jgi:hypothetical protein
MRETRHAEAIVIAASHPGTGSPSVVRVVGRRRPGQGVAVNTRRSHCERSSTAPAWASGWAKLRRNLPQPATLGVGPPPAEIAPRGRSPAPFPGRRPPRQGGWRASRTGPRSDATRGGSPGRPQRKITAQWSEDIPCTGRRPAALPRHRRGDAHRERRRPRPRDRGPRLRALRRGRPSGLNGRRVANVISWFIVAQLALGPWRSRGEVRPAELAGAMGVSCWTDWRTRLDAARAGLVWDCTLPDPETRGYGRGAVRVLELAFVRTREVTKRVVANREEKASRAERRRKARQEAKEAVRASAPPPPQVARPTPPTALCAAKISPRPSPGGSGQCSSGSGPSSDRTPAAPRLRGRIYHRGSLSAGSGGSRRSSRRTLAGLGPGTDAAWRAPVRRSGQRQQSSSQAASSPAA